VLLYFDAFFICTRAQGRSPGLPCSLDPFLLVTFFFRNDGVVFFHCLPPPSHLLVCSVHALVLLVFRYLLRFTWVMSVNVDGHLYSAAIDFTCLFDRVST